MANVKLSNVIRRAQTKVDKDDTDLVFYVGGEHIESENIRVHSRGIIAESTIGPMFYYGFKAGDFLLVSRNPHLKKAGLVDFPENKECESIAIVNNKRNQFISVFAHLRDSFAHGRLNMYDIGTADDYVFAFEDVIKNQKKNRYEVTARMILRKSTLLKWIDLIEHGYTEQ